MHSKVGFEDAHHEMGRTVSRLIVNFEERQRMSAYVNGRTKVSHRPTSGDQLFSGINTASDDTPQIFRSLR